MIEETGGFDESFFLYCEDADLGLRAQWAGWTCRYVPGAVVFHRYSHSAGRASKLKAFYVERNRLLLILKNFPLAPLALSPFAAAARYWFHLSAMREGKGAAAQFRRDGNSGWWLVTCALRAHGSALLRLADAWRKRRAVRKTAKIKTSDFNRLLTRYRISLRKVASL
jgi:GT2 family glycosyltransferase